MSVRTAMATALLAGGLLLTGCSESEPPGREVPELADQLDAVDRAVEAREWGRARAAVEGLVAMTATAEVNGRISDDQADRILEAAREVLAELPGAGDAD